VKILFFLSTFFLLNTSYSIAKSFGDYKGAVYIRNYDGDTITFNLPGLHPIIGKKINIRVNGIDTPEMRGKCEKEKFNAQQAQQMVADTLKNVKQITLKNMRRGKYFRIAADVIIDGENLADLLIKKGMAVRYNGGRKTHKWCEG
jgi:micrococcal nuclease